MSFRGRPLPAITIFILLLFFPSQTGADILVGNPQPQSVLYIGNSPWSPTDDKIFLALKCLGHNPLALSDAAGNGFLDDLAGMGFVPEDFQQIWDVRVSGAPADAIIFAEQMAYDNYLMNGGSLFLAGEDSGYVNRNNSLMSYLNTSINTGGQMTAGPILDTGNDPRLNPNGAIHTAAQNFDTDPVNMGGPAWTMGVNNIGGFPLGMHGSGQPVILNGAGSDFAPNTRVHAIAYTANEIQAPQNAGKVFVLMESPLTSWNNVTTQACLGPSGSELDFLKNIVDFLAQDRPTDYVAKYSVPSTCPPGDSFDYYLIYENRGVQTTNVWVYDTLPMAMGYTFMPPAGPPVDYGPDLNDLVGWNLGTVNPYQTVTLTITMQAPLIPPFWANNTAFLKRDSRTDMPSNWHTFSAQPGVDIWKSANPFQGDVGDTIVYSLGFNPAMGGGPGAWDDFDTDDNMALWMHTRPGSYYSESAFPGVAVHDDPNIQIVLRPETMGNQAWISMQYWGCDGGADNGIILRYDPVSGEHYYLELIPGLLGLGSATLYYSPDAAESSLVFVDEITNLSFGDGQANFSGLFTDISLNAMDNWFNLNINLVPVGTLTDPLWRIPGIGLHGFKSGDCPQVIEQFNANGDPVYTPKTGVTVWDTIPAKTTFLNCYNGCTESAGLINWDVGMLTMGGGNVSYRVVIAGPVTVGEVIPNMAQIKSDSEGPYDSWPADVTIVPAGSCITGAAIIRDVCSTCTYTDIASAVAASFQGNIIEIRDSGVYNETFAPDKSLTLRVQPGMGYTPTINGGASYGIDLTGVPTCGRVTVLGDGGLTVTSGTSAVYATGACGSIKAEDTYFDTSGDWVWVIWLDYGSPFIIPCEFDRCVIDGTPHPTTNFAARLTTVAAPSPNARFRNCLIYGIANTGAGLAITGTETGLTCEVVNCTIKSWGNALTSDDPVSIINTLVAGTFALSDAASYADVSYSAFQGPDPGGCGPGCIFGVNPDDEFVGLGDYHLKTGASCTENGTDTSARGVTDDLDKLARPQDSFYDIGAYEYVLPKTSTPTSTRTLSSTVTLTPTASASHTVSYTTSTTWTPTSSPTSTTTPTATPNVVVMNLWATAPGDGRPSNDFNLATDAYLAPDGAWADSPADTQHSYTGFEASGRSGAPDQVQLAIAVWVDSAVTDDDITLDIYWNQGSPGVPFTSRAITAAMLNTAIGSGNQAIFYFDVTADRIWDWADFGPANDLEVTININRNPPGDGVNYNFDAVGWQVSGTVAATPTDTPTATRSATESATYTPSPSITPTGTPTRTATESGTPTASSSHTATITTTRTYTDSVTPTSTLTFTPTATTTSTPSDTLTDTRTATTTFTPPGTLTDTRTATMTFTPPGTLTDTRTATMTFTPPGTLTDTRTITVSASRTVTPSETVSFTPSSSNTLSVTATVTPSITATATPTTTVTITHTASHTLTDTSSATNTWTRTNTNTATPTHTSSITFTSTVTQTATPIQHSWTVTPTYTKSASHTPSWTVTGTATKSASHTPTATATDTPTFTSTDTSTATATSTPTATETATRTATTTGTTTHTTTPSHTKTATPTATATNTYTASHTPTDTASATNTWTRTNTNTATPTHTPSITVTSTITQTATTIQYSWTVTPTYTESASHTPTSTVTRTATESTSHTPTATATDTPTATATDTPTSTTTHTPTATATATRTATTTDTDTCTATPTVTETVTRTATTTDTDTYTATPTVTETVTRTATTTDTDTCTATPTVTRTATPTSSHTVTFTPSASHTTTATPTVTETHTVTFTASASNTETNTATVTPTHTVTFTASASQTETNTATATPTHTVTFTASASQTETATPTHSGTYTQTATPSGTPTATPTFTATLTGSVTHTPTHTLSATYSATDSVTPTGSVSYTSTPTVTPQELKIIDAQFYPNPWDGIGSAYLTLMLQAPSDRVVLKIFTSSYRKVRETVLEISQYGSYIKVPFDGKDALGYSLANGVYFYSIEVYQGSNLFDHRMGKIVILR